MPSSKNTTADNAKLPVYSVSFRKGNVAFHDMPYRAQHMLLQLYLAGNGKPLLLERGEDTKLHVVVAKLLSKRISQYPSVIHWLKYLTKNGWLRTNQAVTHGATCPVYELKCSEHISTLLVNLQTAYMSPFCEKTYRYQDQTSLFQIAKFLGASEKVHISLNLIDYIYRIKTHGVIIITERLLTFSFILEQLKQAILFSRHKRLEERSAYLSCLSNAGATSLSNESLPSQRMIAHQPSLQSLTEPSEESTYWESLGVVVTPPRPSARYGRSTTDNPVKRQLSSYLFYYAINDDLDREPDMTTGRHSATCCCSCRSNLRTALNQLNKKRARQAKGFGSRLLPTSPEALVAEHAGDTAPLSSFAHSTRRMG